MVENKIIAFTGHTNIEKCTGRTLVKMGEVYDKTSYDMIYNDIQLFMEKLANKKQMKISDFTIVVGMARGIDEIVALYAINMNINLIISVPFKVEWHKNRGPSRGIRSQAIWYDYILAYPKLTIREIPKGNHYFANFARNVDMVEIANAVVSYKKYDSAGTDHCIKEAKKRNKYLGNIPDILLEK